VKRVVILGASGFIGRHCIQALLPFENMEVIGVSRQRPEWAERQGIADRWRCCDALDIVAITELLLTVKPTHLLHLAWFSGHSQIWSTIKNLDWVAASLRIATSFARAGGQRLVMAGSCAEYGGSGCFEERTAVNPSSLYGMAKRSTHETINLMAQQEGISFAWPRLFHMYGPFEDERRLVASATHSLLTGKPFPCSDGMQVRDFLFIEDVASALITLLFSDVEGAINVGSGLPITLRRLLETIGDEIGRPELLHFGQKNRTEHDPDVLIPSINKQCIELGWLPKHTLFSGIKRSVEWSRANLSDKRRHEGNQDGI